MRRACLLLAIGCLLGCAPKDKVPEETVSDASAADGGGDAEGGAGPTSDGSIEDGEGGNPGEVCGEIPEAATYDAPNVEGEPCAPTLNSCLPLLCCPGNPRGPDCGFTYTC
ncbi:MAG TPA: hypothetical protein VIF09_14750, partial [Polyangiaceae bacterium]